MSPKKSSQKRQPSGFQQNSTEDLEKIALQSVHEGNWEKAISTYASLSKLSQRFSSEEVKRLFRQAATAGNQNKDILSLSLHCQLLAVAPNHADGMRNMSLILRRSGYYNDAILFINKCLKIQPNSVANLNTYGTILANLGRNEDAIEAFRKALAIDPKASNVNSNLANEYHLKALIDLAYIHSSRAIDADSSRAPLWLDHLTHLRRVCEYDSIEKINWWNIINEIPASFIWSAFLQMLTLSESDDDQLRLRSAIESWGNEKHKRAIEQPLEKLVPPRLKESDPLRIGFVSADFKDHSVARFIWPLFKHLDRDQFSLFCYSTYPRSDAWRERFKKSATAFRDVGDLSPQELCRTVRSDGIHVLFDLTGFTNGSRTGSLAWRAAPAQVSWLGFPGTSGLPEMDYLFLDQYLKPSKPALITEKPLLSSGTTVCFSEIDAVPITPIIPELKRGSLTIGTLNNSYKLTRNTIKRWASILRELPDAKFLFVRREFQSYLLRQNVLREFENNGVESQRIHFYNNRLEQRHYLDCYNEIDMSLDTFPVTGGTTTTDALWMGVPVIGLEGSNIHQRVCSAILHHAGHPEWIAKNDQEFMQIALDVASNQELRIKLRQTLRTEIQKSPLCDSVKFASDFSECMNSLKSEWTNHLDD